MTDCVFIHKRSSYQDATIVPNATAQRDDLTFAARGLLVYLLSLPPAWKVRETELVGRSPAGRDHVRAVIRELEAFGYLKRHQTRLPDGRVGPSHWEVWDVPHEVVVKAPAADPKPRGRRPKAAPSTENPSAVAAPLTGKPSTENPSTDKTQSAQGQSPWTENPSTAVLYQATADGLTVDGKSNSIERTTVQKEQQENQERNPPCSPSIAADPPQAADRPKREPRARSFSPTQDDIPAGLLPVALELLDFWAEKGGSRSSRAWARLLSELIRIQEDPAGGTEILREQLQAGIQAAWQSVTYANWARYGRAPSRPAAGSGSRGHRPRTQAREEFMADFLSACNSRNLRTIDTTP